MWTRILALFSAPVFEDEDKTRTARLLHRIVLISLVITPAILAGLIYTSAPTMGFAAVSGMLLVEVLTMRLYRSGRVQAGATLFVCLLWLILVATAFFSGGIAAPPYIILIGVVLMAGLLLGGRAGISFASASALAGLAYLFGGQAGLLPEAAIRLSPAGTWLLYSVLFLIAASLFLLANNGLRDALDRARSNERSLAESNRQLQAIRTSLEEQVQARTKDLERRSGLLQASAEVSRAAASMLDPDELVRRTVDLIGKKFELYYTGLFLVDRSGEWAVLRAGTGEAGQAMLARNHRLPVGSGMIGWSIANNRPRVAQDISQDAVQLATQELPNTRSEAAIPLRYRNQTIGALSVQSERPDAFGEVEVSVLQIMADQVAAALENARLYSESQAALERARRAYGEISQQAWNEILSRREAVGYRLQTGSTPDQASVAQARRIWSPEMQQAVVTGRPMVTEKDGRPGLWVPVKVRDHVIGVLNLNKNPGEAWEDEELHMFAELSDQLGQALESARLYQETQRRAAHEHISAEVTARIRETLDMETVLQTAVEEVRRYLNLPEVNILIGTPPHLAPDGSGEASRSAWLDWEANHPGMAFQSDRDGIRNVDPVWRREAEQALLGGRTVRTEDEDRQNLYVPIRVRGSAVGVLDTCKLKAGGQWTPEEIELLERIVDQLALALDSARLYSETTRKAERERLVGEVTARIRETMNVESVLKTAADEIYQALGLEEMTILLTPQATRDPDGGGDYGKNPAGNGSPPTRK